MLVEVARRYETLGADLTDVRPFAGVRPGVSFQTAALREPRVTHVAAVRLHSAVSQQVALEVAAFGELGVAEVAGERLHAAVGCQHVLPQVPAAGEPDRAAVARERLVTAAVGPRVSRQLSLLPEHLITHITR